MTATSTSPAAAPSLAGPQLSLRERKKQATRRLLRRAALDLVAERGLANVTVEDIAEAADVSPRTFFNYFASKEAALFGGDPDRTAGLRARIAAEAPGAPAITALRAVLTQDAEAVAAELRSLGGDSGDWLRRMKVARADPHVRAAHAGQMAMIERAIGEGLAARLGADQETDPYPGVLAAAAVGVVRACMAFWAESAGGIPLAQLIDQAFQALADGLPEDAALRQVTRNQITGNQITGNAVPANARVTGAAGATVTDGKDTH
ncbi:MAG TPA: TetR family transcriptional regulator [Trebonia sp.]|nr:TetR family transcriptional regulator [Trebonia sp.]